jgi:hypothetical protein
VDSVGTVLTELEARIEANPSRPLDEDTCWDAIHAALDQLNIRRKSDLTLPLRHALTGRKVREREWRGAESCSNVEDILLACH